MKRSLTEKCIGLPISLLKKHDKRRIGSEVEPQGVRPFSGVHHVVVDIRHDVLDKNVRLGLLQGEIETVILNVDGREIQRLQAGQTLIANADGPTPVKEPQHALAKSNLGSRHAEHFRSQWR